MKLVLHAPGVHQGGGKTLLLALLRGVGQSLSCVLIVDTRFEIPTTSDNIKVFAFPPTLWGRARAERRLASLCCDDDLVLCMNSLPPFLTCAGQVAVYLQNRHFFETANLVGISFRARLRVFVLQSFLRHRLNARMRLIVQTPSMQQAAHRALNVLPEVMPFCDLAGYSNATAAAMPPRFLYPATPDPHKNHLALFQAWRLLHKEGIRAELHVTIAGKSPLSLRIDCERADGILIINHGEVDAATMATLYQNCTALIFPSKMESFGLPLLEAQAAGLPIIAAERDYVRDVAEPAETFDPDSPVSIARAVRRFLGAAEQLRPPMQPAEFIRHVLATRG